MPISVYPRTVIFLALGVVSRLSLAQAPTPPLLDPAVVRAGTDNPQQLPAIRGEFERFTLTGRGEIEGLILKDGTEVKTSPELSAQIALSIKPGDSMTIHGLRAAALPLVRAVSITNDTTHRMVADSAMTGPMAASPPPRRGNAADAGRRTGNGNFWTGADGIARGAGRTERRTPRERYPAARAAQPI